MGDTGYRHDDPWHSWINLVYGVHCDRCGHEIAVDWSQVHDGGNEDFLRQCVAVARQAQDEGWTHLGGTSFRCADCAAMRRPARS